MANIENFRKCMTMINLYNIRNCVALFSPLYISICAALLLDLGAHLSFSWESIWYFSGLFSFLFACYIGNELSVRCNNYSRIYDIEINEYRKGNVDQPDRKRICEQGEDKLKKNTRIFQYYGVFGLGLLGLFFIFFSYQIDYGRNCEQMNDIMTLNRKIDTLKTVNCEQTLHILELRHNEDSIHSILKSIILPSKHDSIKR